MLNEEIKKYIYFPDDVQEEDIKKELKKIINSICKPCWELKYCPYGPLVEKFPFKQTLRAEAIEHNNYLKKCLEINTFGDGIPLDEKRRKYFEKEINNFNPLDYPEEISEFEIEAECTMFGHLCPVFFVNEPFTETEEMRKNGRHIPFQTKIRVARRDNYTCQICSKHLKDDELEFDHIIPLSKGGSSEEHNLRLTCFKCNRSKSNKVNL